MAKDSETQTVAVSSPVGESKALAVIEKAGGVKTSRDFSNVMASLMHDLLKDCVSPRVGNAVCNAGGKLLKMAELELKYGRTKSEMTPEGEKVLALASV